VRLPTIFIAFVTLAVSAAWPQEPSKPAPPSKVTATAELKPTEVQSLRLQVKQKDALLAKQRLEALQTVIQGAQADYQRALQDLTTTADSVKLENGWRADTQFDPNQLTFSPAPPTPPTAPKDAAKEKKP
jgi:hypothetical protein